jgi:hypothetical protein
MKYHKSEPTPELKPVLLAASLLQSACLADTIKNTHFKPPHMQPVERELHNAVEQLLMFRKRLSRHFGIAARFSIRRYFL